jgi:uncharacterized spore protein YtfJ
VLAPRSAAFVAALAVVAIALTAHYRLGFRPFVHALERFAPFVPTGNVTEPSARESSLRPQWAVTDEGRPDVTTAIQDGSTLADELLQRIGQTVGDKAKVSAVFGEPVERESITVIPVAKSRFGFGGGGGAGTRSGQEGSGGGGGGGAVVSPVGYIEVYDGSARFKRISGPVDVLAVVATAALAALVVRRILS